MEPDPDLKRVFRTTIIINGALVASLFLDAFIVELIKFQLKPFPGLLVSGLRHQSCPTSATKWARSCAARIHARR